MLEFARWKYVLVAIVMVVASIFALPNVFGEDAALQVARKDRAAIADDGRKAVEEYLRGQGVSFSRSYVDEGRLMLHFDAVPAQLRARDLVNENFKTDYVTALSFASRAPDWLRKVGLRPMPLGLDLRGGLYLLYQVDIAGAVDQLLEVYEQDARRALSQQNIAFTDVIRVTEGSERPNGLRVQLPVGADVGQVRGVLRRLWPDLTITSFEASSGPIVQLVLTAAQIKDARTMRFRKTSPRCEIASTNSVSPSPSCSGRASTESLCSCPAYKTPPRSRICSARWRLSNFASSTRRTMCRRPCNAAARRSAPNFTIPATGCRRS
jgi:preprotein translocase subunit SecD